MRGSNVFRCYETEIIIRRSIEIASALIPLPPSPAVEAQIAEMTSMQQNILELERKHLAMKQS
jgi:hypothetical protein